MDALTLLLPPAFGFAIGYATNALAIAMLFRPHREVRILGFALQGMVPRRKDEIAVAVSRVVATELLREESVAARLAGPEVRQALAVLVGELGARALDREYGAAAEELDPVRAEALERALAHGIREAGRAAQGWVDSAAVREAVVGLVGGLLERTPGELLGGERDLLARAAGSRLEELLASPELPGRVRTVLAQSLVALAAAGEPVGRLVPPEAVAGLTAAAARAVPALLGRFEEALLAPANVVRLKGAVRAGIVAYLMEPRGGVVKNLVRHAALLGRERIYREADEIVDQNLHRLRELVHREENRARVEEGIAEALGAFLGRTPGELLAALPPEALGALYERGAAELCSWLRRPGVAQALTAAAAREVDRVFDVPLGDLARAAGVGEGAARRWADQAVAWAAGGGLGAVADREAEGLARLAVRVPLGRPRRFLPPSFFDELVGLALDRLMPVVAAKVPEILRVVDVRGLIEREIRAFSPAEVERVIQGVAGRELRAITGWGGVLGALVGGLQSALWFFWG